MADVRAVVFDIGGVLLDWDPRYLYGELIPDRDDLDRFLAEICTPHWNASLDAGRPMPEACAELSRQHPDQAELIRAWQRQDAMVRGEIVGTSALVERLQDADVPMFLLTNMPADVFAARWDAYDVLRRFDGAVVSGEEGVLKPTAEIFRRLAERFDLEPASTLFIDDAIVNVEGAQASGYIAHRFVDARTLEIELQERGLLP